jgi:8-oxo-dGTP pyrophosphatase MutT (NUDIX family)
MSSSLGFDPRDTVIEPRPAEPALPEQALSFLELETLFSKARKNAGFPLWSPELLRDRRRPDRIFNAETATPASVLIGLVADQTPSVVLTLRTAHLSDHAAQISFPGGRAEPHDLDVHATALREAQEEIGLDPILVNVWGTLPHYLTVSGYRVTPVIGAIHVMPQYRPDAHEVAEVFHVPLSFLMNPRNHQRRLLPNDKSPTGESIRFYAMPYADPNGRERFIWGATAAMLRNLYHFLHAAWHQHCNFAADR